MPSSTIRWRKQWTLREHDARFFIYKTLYKSLIKYLRRVHLVLKFYNLKIDFIKFLVVVLLKSLSLKGNPTLSDSRRLFYGRMRLCRRRRKPRSTSKDAKLL
jgi:hypothetical protein